LPISKRLKKGKIKPEEIRRKRPIHQNAAAFKTLSKILSTICTCKDKRMMGLQNWKEPCDHHITK